MTAILYLLGAMLAGLGLYYLLLISVFVLPAVFVVGLLGWGLYSALNWVEISKKRSMRILIVEDDIDMAKAAEITFKNLGCPTTIATTLQQADHFLSRNTADLVILDWMLQDNVRATQLLKQAAARRLQNHTPHRPKVITYSSLSPQEIDFPDTLCFEHVEHWQKPLRYADLSKRSSELLAVS